MNTLTTSFVSRLRDRDETAWFERVREQCSTPLSIGEIFNNPLEIVPLIHGRLIDFVRTRLSPIGGITPADITVLQVHLKKYRALEGQVISNQ